MLTRSVSALAIATALAFAPAGPAASTAAADFPVPGAGFTLGLNAEQVRFTCGAATHTIDLNGSTSLTASTPNPARPLSTPMKVTAAELSGTSAAFGTVTASLDGPQTGELVKKSVTKPFPARHVLPLKLTITFEHAASCGAAGTSAHGALQQARQPLVLETKNRAVLVGFEPVA